MLKSSWGKGRFAINHRHSLALWLADGVVSVAHCTLSQSRCSPVPEAYSHEPQSGVSSAPDRGAARTRGNLSPTESLRCCMLPAGGWKLEGQLGDAVLPLQGGHMAAVQQAVATTGKCWHLVTHVETAGPGPLHCTHVSGSLHIHRISKLRSMCQQLLQHASVIVKTTSCNTQ